MLFTQASSSLTSLAQGVREAGLMSNSDSPPPYNETRPPDSGLVGDVKRRNTQDGLSTTDESLDALQLVRANRLDLIQRYLEQGSDMDNLDPTTKRSAIMEAARLRRVGAARLLLGYACRVHLKDVDGWTALHYAASQGDAEICQLLLDVGAQLDEYSNTGSTPLSLAAHCGHTDAVICLLNSWAAQMSSGTALLNGFLEAVKSGNVRTAEVFVERGIVPKKVQDSWRPIIYAGKHQK